MIGKRVRRRCALLSVAVFGLSLRLDAPCWSQVSGPVPTGQADYIVDSGLPNPSRGPGPVTGLNANQLLGASRFYNAGYTGTRAVMSNVEAGYIWNGHETLTHVALIPTSGNALPEADRHATVVGMLMGGRVGGASPGEYQRGIAPG